MARSLLSGFVALSVLTLAGCGVQVSTAPAPAPPAPTPSMPESSISTTPAMPEGMPVEGMPAEGTPSSTDVAATPPMPMPGADGTIPEGGDPALDNSTYAVPPMPTGPDSTTATTTEGEPASSGPLGFIGNLIGGLAQGQGTPEMPTAGVEGIPGMPNPYGQPGAATAPPEKPFEKMTLKERAESCFEKGEESEGFRWLYAHAVADDLRDAGDTLDQFRWIPGPKRPSLASRFGVAVKFDASNFAGIPPVIGDDVPGLLAGRSAEGQPASEIPGATGGSGRPKEIPTEAPATMRFFAGDLALEFLERFEASREEEAFGVALAELASGEAEPAEGADLNPYGMPEGYSVPQPSPEVDSTGERPAGGRDQEPSLDLRGGDQITPGLVWLGFETSTSGAARKGAPRGVDCVLLVDVRISVGRNAPPRNKTKVMAIDVVSGKPVASTPLLDHFDVYELRETRPNAPDPVEGAVDELFETLKANYAMQEMPEIAPESALNRARQLIADPPADPLPALAEMRYYLKQGLLDEAQYAIAVNNLVGEETGAALVSTKAKDRKAAVEKLVAAMDSDSESGDDDSKAEKARPEPSETSTEETVGP